jgi:hypothetical protein
LSCNCQSIIVCSVETKLHKQNWITLIVCIRFVSRTPRVSEFMVAVLQRPFDLLRLWSVDGRCLKCGVCVSVWINKDVPSITDKKLCHLHMFVFLIFLHWYSFLISVSYIGWCKNHLRLDAWHVAWCGVIVAPLCIWSRVMFDLSPCQILRSCPHHFTTAAKPRAKDSYPVCRSDCYCTCLKCCVFWNWLLLYIISLPWNKWSCCRCRITTSDARHVVITYCRELSVWLVCQEVAYVSYWVWWKSVWKCAHWFKVATGSYPVTWLVMLPFMCFVSFFI